MSKDRHERNDLPVVSDGQTCLGRQGRGVNEPPPLARGRRFKRVWNEGHEIRLCWNGT